ncbi:MAG: hypothetical protein HGB32_02750 [Geobacteraceae bacterium]|nr:hypothetical protein [Geobacteraceae bacterium]NTW79053.1 hypothetical protein [Geobacteraceae bacterium]
MIIETVTLDSGLSIILLDQTRHYFGGYFHVKVLVYCDIPLEQHYFENDVEYGYVVKKMGTTVRFERILDKMAVPESEIDSVRSQLIQAFHETTKAYLSTPDFAPRFVRSEYLKHVKKPSQIQSSRA